MHSYRYYISALFPFVILTCHLVASVPAKEGLRGENQNDFLPTPPDKLSKKSHESTDHVSQNSYGEQSDSYYVLGLLNLKNRRNYLLNNERMVEEAEYYVDDAVNTTDDDLATFQEPSYFYNESDVDPDLDYYYHDFGSNSFQEQLNYFTTLANQYLPFGLVITVDQMIFILGLILALCPFVFAYILSKLCRRKREDDWSEYGLMYNPSDYTYEYA